MKAGMNRVGAAGLLMLLLPACGIQGGGTLNPAVAPGIPTDVTARAGNRSVTIDWKPSATGAQYSVGRSLLPRGPFFSVSVPGQFPSPTRYVDPDLISGTTYYYQIVAVNSFGKSSPSVVVSATPGFHAVAVSARLDATNLALLRDGTVWQWGTTHLLQVLDAPSQVKNLSDITSISCGSDHSLALASDGRIWAWGKNTVGQLGTTSPNTPIPVLVDGLPDAIAVASGGTFSLAITHEGKVQVWGGNSNGEFGTGSTTPSSSLVPIEIPGLTDIIAIDAGYSSGIALRKDGLVLTWGSNDKGQCGTGSASSGPVAVGQVSGLNGVTAISAGYDFHLALRSDGTVWGWGENAYGQLGIGSVSTPVTQPTQTISLNGVVSIAGGNYHSLAVLNDGTMKSWGYQFSGALGNGLLYSVGVDSTPMPVLGMTNVVAASAAYANSVAVTDDGTVYTWGNNTGGELGNGSGLATHVPTELKNVTGATAIAAEALSSFFVRGLGEVWGMGIDSSGELGNGSSLTPVCDPIQATGITSISAIVSGSGHCLALDVTTGNVWGWGGNGSGQVGNGTIGAGILSPAPVPVPSGITTIAAGRQHSFAIRNDQTLWSWGDNTYSQLGRTIVGNGAYSPGQVSVLTGVVSAAGGGWYSVAVKSDGTVWAWGENSYGQLGLGATGPPVATPTQVPGVSDALAVTTGWAHTVVLLRDGTVLAWGQGDHGQLGNGIVNSPSPLPVLGLTDVTAVAGGEEFSLALRSDGTVMSWGNNDYSQLGNTAFPFTSTPTPVEGLKNVAGIAAGMQHSMALLTNGTVQLWGQNGFTQLGVARVNASVTPVVISR